MLKDIVYDNGQAHSAQPQVSSIEYGCQEDGGCIRSESISSSGVLTPSNSTSTNYQMSGALPTSHSIDFGVAGYGPTAEVHYGESSGPNKRPYIEESGPGPSSGAIPAPAPQIPASGPYQFQAGPDPAALDTRTKKKGQKKQGKKAEPQPLIGMFDDKAGRYDPPVSIRDVLLRGRIDMSYLEFFSWSPQACREGKRLLTRFTKKRLPKPKQSVQAPPVPTVTNPFTFQPGFGQNQYQQIPLPIPSNNMPTQPQFVNQTPMVATQPNLMPAPPQQPSVTQAAGPGPVQNLYDPASAPFGDIGTVSSSQIVAPDMHTRFLGTLAGMEKAFRLPCSVTRRDGVEEHLDKSIVQADQGSDMNVMSMGLARKLMLDLRPLAEVGFKGLSMRVADSRESPLHHYVWLRVTVSSISRDIRCFVAPEGEKITGGNNEHLSLLLGLPWLWMVDAILSVRLSKVTVGDSAIGEVPRDIVGPEFVFCKDHNLLMYPKSLMTKYATVEDADSSDSDSSTTDDDGSDEDVYEAPFP